jgi:hypothetical protein
MRARQVLAEVMKMQAVMGAKQVEGGQREITLAARLKVEPPRWMRFGPFALMGLEVMAEGRWTKP